MLHYTWISLPYIVPTIRTYRSNHDSAIRPHGGGHHIKQAFGSNMRRSMLHMIYFPVQSHLVADVAAGVVRGIL